ncbi:MAG: T9SS type A sorting domain-containing protein [Ignavibacteriaceae bacterium]|nr:T9SS type A sorting domain-containing protein [Ignavibacteriaceae bacterium]
MRKFLYFSFLILLSGLTFAQKDILVNWECNMEIERLSGRFDPATDTVEVKGDFNGWSNPGHILDQSIDPDVYVSSIPDTIFDAEVGDTIIAGYKFFYTPNNWENDPNKIHVLTQQEYDDGVALESRAFNNGTLSSVTNQPTDVLFQVDVNGAVSAINNLPFPVINTVHLAGGTQPLQWPSLGWPDGEIGVMIPCYDDGTHGDVTAGDLVFSTTVTFPAYTIFHVNYKFGINYGDAVNNGGGNDNENAIGANHEFELFPLAWYCETKDTFGIMGLKDFVTDVKDNTPSTTPTSYALGQNYPNPFNPSTKISYSIPVEGFVNLDVYNSIGQKVASLVNENKTAGTYEVNFDAAKLSSGIYFYKIASGNFTETKKMILMK